MADALGKKGSKTISGTGAITPDVAGTNFNAIQALSALTFSAATVETGFTSFDLTNATIPAGAVVFGRWSSITPSAGDGVAYY